VAGNSKYGGPWNEEPGRRLAVRGGGKREDGGLGAGGQQWLVPASLAVPTRHSRIKSGLVWKSIPEFRLKTDVSVKSASSFRRRPESRVRFPLITQTDAGSKEKHAHRLLPLRIAKRRTGPWMKSWKIFIREGTREKADGSPRRESTEKIERYGGQTSPSKSLSGSVSKSISWGSGLAPKFGTGLYEFRQGL